MAQQIDRSQIRVVGFDLDQTLYPKSPEIDEKIQKFLYETIAAHKNVSLDVAEGLFKDRYQGGTGMSGSQTLTDLGIPNAGDVIQEALEQADIVSILKPEVETKQLLTDIRARFGSIDLITGSNLYGAQKKLAALGLDIEMFNNVITADESRKTTGDSYRLWLSAYPHLAPSQFLYVGDRMRSDHEIPSALGIQTILVYVSKPDDSVSAIQLPDFYSLKSVLLTKI